MANKLIACLLFALATTATAQSSALEPILVGKVAQFGDFMPPVPEDMRPQTQITFKAWSNGCTSADSFEVLVNVLENGTQVVTIDRVVEDRCRRVAMLEDITVTTADLAISSAGWSNGQNVVWNPIIFANPVLVEDNTTH